MRRDKALLPFRGVPLAQVVAAALQTATQAVSLVGDPQRLQHLGFPVVPDLYPGEGPLGGILTALTHTTSEWNFVAACDLPELDGDTVEELFRAAEASGAGVLLPVGAADRPEPLCAVYRHVVAERIAAAFEEGVRKVTAALAGIPVVRYKSRNLRAFQNVNTPEDWAAYGAR
jgi:molybdopterin-guanine dinucleotide biosynthesis protein A